MEHPCPILADAEQNRGTSKFLRKLRNKGVMHQKYRMNSGIKRKGKKYGG